MTTDPLLRAFNDDGIVVRTPTGETTKTVRKVGRTEAALRTGGYREPILPKPVRASHEWEELDRTIEAIKQTTTRPEPAPLYQPHDACVDPDQQGEPEPTTPPVAVSIGTWPLWVILAAVTFSGIWFVGAWDVLAWAWRHL